MQSHNTITNDEARATSLLLAGDVALAQGNRAQAHDFWRQAAVLRPQDEQIWLSLLEVLEDRADRIVCLENILIINPNNTEAARELEKLHQYQAPLPLTPRALSREDSIIMHALRISIILVSLIGLFALGLTIGILLNYL